MDDEKPKYEVPTAEDYYSDDTQGRKEEDFARRERCLPPIVRAQRAAVAAIQAPAAVRSVARVVARITEAELNARLDKLGIPGPTDPVDMCPTIRDHEFSHISELLRQFGQGEWSLRPRTFCVLRGLGQIGLMDAFIALKRTDAFLPYDDRNLPDVIKGAEARNRFLRLQGMAQSSKQIEDLEKEGGQHSHFLHSADGYFRPMALLGQGGTGIVERVHGLLSLKQFARKKLHRGVSALKDETTMARFMKELVVLKAASHRHLVKLVSSYTDPEYLGLITTPVAEMDLKVYLMKKPKNESERHSRKACLRTFYGCLISALEYLHNNRIIHKDIKPSNVLVKSVDVYLTDFGTSRMIGEYSRSLTTASRSDEITLRYSAPEVAELSVSEAI